MRIIFYFFLLISFTAQAQKKLSGYVFVSGSTKPVASATVYLANTSAGTATNEQGAFLLQPFPEGRYDLVVSCVGYETYHTTVQSDQLPVDLKIQLVSKVEDLAEVIVESYDKDGWNKWSKTFIDNFIGTSSFAYDCKLLNPDVIHLKLDKKRNTLKATADEDLVIENHALGYILKYSLTKFEYNFDTGEFLYMGFPFFEEMQTKRKGLQQRWIENRQKAYYGSIMHLMRSLYSNRVKEEKFEIREWANIPKAERKRVREIYQAQSKKPVYKRTVVIMPSNNEFELKEMDTAKVIHPDSLHYYKSIIQQINNEEILVDRLLTSDSLVSVMDTSKMALIYKKKLQVIYTEKMNPIAYQRYLPAGSAFKPTTSELSMVPGEAVFILSNGTYYEGINLLISGYLSWWEKMCNKLPYDYVPPIAEKNKPQIH